MEISIRDVSKYYGKKQALKQVNLSVSQGMFGLLGRNGAGKTTLMKTLATLLTAEEGEILICGIPVGKSSEIRRIVGYLPQDFAIYPGMKVHEAMDYLGILSGMHKADRRERIPMLLERVNLDQCAHMKVKSMSGGMRRRLGIAQALLHDPQVLIVDEPTAGLDPEERVRFRNLLSEMAQDRIVLLSTHIVGDIEAACEEIAILDAGEIIYRGNVTQFLENMRGKVFQAVVSRKELPLIQEEYPVISMLQQREKVQIRFCADNEPFRGAVPCEPNVEDAYMCLMSQRKGD